MPTYDELQQKVKEFEVQEEIFRTIIQQMEQLYAQVASSQSEIEKKNEAIEEEKGKLQAILKNIADALVVVNPGGRVILANSVFCDFFNADVNAVHNAHISEVIDNIELVKTILDVIEEPERTIMKQIQLQDGCFIKNTSSSILLDDLLLGVVSTFRDVTIEVQMDKMKTDFISTVSHELRTPLTSVLGFANIIKKRLEEVIFPVIDDGEARVSRAASQVRQNLDIIISEGERLTNLINDVLDIAKIEAGRVEWKDEDVDIAEVFRRAAVTTSSLFQSKGLYLEGEVEGGGLIVRGDRDRMIQVVTNLLSNAVKFTDGGGTITYRIRRNAGYVRSEVEDTGNGIPSDMLERVFEKFRQVGDTLTDRPKGTGLGLPICREIINHHGGRIWAESKEGGGSRFIFELPLKAAGQGGHTEIQREVLLTSIDNHIKGRAQGETVLIVDDDVSIRVLLSQYLQEKGYRAVEAVDGKDAIGKTRAMMPDLILLDIMMPDLSGYDVLRVLKNDDTTREIPVIVISALENRDKGLMLGAADYITKPVDEERLFDSIQRVMNEGQRNNRCRVMIIDRDRESCREIAEAMKGRNFEVIQSCCDTEDIRKGLEATPDIILVDMGLVEDGYINEICREDSIRDLMIKSKILYIVKGSEGNAEDTDSR